MYGVAIPTADGIRKVLELVGANKYGGQRVLWHNLREEPVCFFTSFCGCFFVFSWSTMKSLLSPQHVYVRNLEYVACFDMVTYCGEACEQYLAVGLDYGFKVNIID